MLTQKLYENDSYLLKFDAKVLKCTPCAGGFEIILDRTAFFPEGGGQASDTGLMNGEAVTDVQEKDGEIVHVTAVSFSEGETVTGEVDRKKRFSAMQNHSGEHILSGILHADCGCNNIGFHLGDDTVTLDVDGKLTDEQILAAEKKANLAVYANLPVTVTYPTPQELEKLDYRSKLSTTENIRIVTIGDVDCCACCAPHVARTGEIGIIKVLSHYPHKRGTRIEMLCGLRALADYSAKNNANAAIMKLLAAPSGETVEAVKKTLDKTAALSQEIRKLKEENALASLTAETVNGITLAFVKGVSFDGLISCANSLTKDENVIALVVSDDGDGSIFVLSSSGPDIQPALSSLRSGLNARGGGKGNFAQGRIPFPFDEIKKFIAG